MPTYFEEVKIKLRGVLTMHGVLPPLPPVRKTAMESVVHALGDTTQELRHFRGVAAILRAQTDALLTIAKMGRPKYSCMEGVMMAPCSCVFCLSIETALTPISIRRMDDGDAPNQQDRPHRGQDQDGAVVRQERETPAEQEGHGQGVQTEEPREEMKFRIKIDWESAGMVTYKDTIDGVIDEIRSVFDISRIGSKGPMPQVTVGMAGRALDTQGRSQDA